MTIRKAVITAAGPGQGHLPLQTLVSPSGETQTAAAILLEEIFSNCIEKVAIIIAPGMERDFSAAIEDHVSNVTFIEQPSPLGYGHAVLCARHFIGQDPFLLMINDHLYLSKGEKSCLAQLLEVAKKSEGSVSAVQPTHESNLPYYGVVGGTRLSGGPGLYEVQHVIEKPTPTLAEQELIIPGLRAGNYLCFFGMHILTPQIMDILAAQETSLKLLSPSLAELARKEKYLACEIEGLRFNIGEPLGLLRAQLGLALASDLRDEVMASMIELIASTR